MIDMIDTCFEWVLCFAAKQKWEVAGRCAVRDSKEVGERFWKDGNRTGERGGRSSSRSQQQYRQKTITARYGGGGVDGMMGCGRVQANKRARKRSGVGGHRPETATFPPSLAGWPFQSGFRQQPHDDFHPYVPPTFLSPLHTISGGSTPTNPCSLSDKTAITGPRVFYTYLVGEIHVLGQNNTPSKSKNLLKNYSF